MTFIRSRSVDSRGKYSIVLDPEGLGPGHPCLLLVLDSTAPGGAYELPAYDPNSTITYYILAEGQPDPALIGSVLGEYVRPGQEETGG